MDEHRLHCDACDFEVHVAWFEDREKSKNRVEKGLYIEVTTVEKSEKDLKYEKVLTFPKSIAPNSLAPNKESGILYKIFAKKDS